MEQKKRVSLPPFAKNKGKTRDPFLLLHVYEPAKAFCTIPGLSFLSLLSSEHSQFDSDCQCDCIFFSCQFSKCATNSSCKAGERNHEKPKKPRWWISRFFFYWLALLVEKKMVLLYLLWPKAIQFSETSRASKFLLRSVATRHHRILHNVDVKSFEVALQRSSETAFDISLRALGPVVSVGGVFGIFDVIPVFFYFISAIEIQSQTMMSRISKVYKTHRIFESLLSSALAWSFCSLAAAAPAIDR
eukprot:g70568.t1